MEFMVSLSASWMRAMLAAVTVLSCTGAFGSAQDAASIAPPPSASPVDLSEIVLFEIRPADFDDLKERIAVGEVRRATVGTAFDAYQRALASARLRMAAELEEVAGHIRAMSPAERRDRDNALAMAEAADSIASVIERAESRAKEAFEVFASVVQSDASDAEARSWASECRRLRRERLINSKKGSPDGSRDLERHVELSALVVRESGEGGSLSLALNAARNANSEAPRTVRDLPQRIDVAVCRYEQSLDEVLTPECWRRASNAARIRAARMREETADLNAISKREIQRWERIERCASDGRDAIEAALLEAGFTDAASAWRSAYDAKLFPQLYAPKKADLAYRWIRSHSLQPEAAQQVDRVYLDYQRSLAPLLEEMKRAMRLAVTRDGVQPAVVGFRREVGQFEPVERQLRAAIALSKATMNSFMAAIGEGLAGELRIAELEGFGNVKPNISIEF